MLPSLALTRKTVSNAPPKPALEPLPVKISLPMPLMKGSGKPTVSHRAGVSVLTLRRRNSSESSCENASRPSASRQRSWPRRRQKGTPIPEEDFVLLEALEGQETSDELYLAALPRSISQSLDYEIIHIVDNGEGLDFECIPACSTCPKSTQPLGLYSDTGPSIPGPCLLKEGHGASQQGTAPGRPLVDELLTRSATRLTIDTLDGDGSPQLPPGFFENLQEMERLITNHSRSHKYKVTPASTLRSRRLPVIIVTSSSQEIHGEFSVIFRPSSATLTKELVYDYDDVEETLYDPDTSYESSENPYFPSFQSAEFLQIPEVDFRGRVIEQVPRVAAGSKKPRFSKLRAFIARMTHTSRRVDISYEEEFDLVMA